MNPEQRVERLAPVQAILGMLAAVARMRFPPSPVATADKEAGNTEDHEEGEEEGGRRREVHLLPPGEGRGLQLLIKLHFPV